jgi:ketosteroid isomerase-like protein
MNHVETTKGMYAAFARGDVPAILERLALDVEWEYGVISNDVPWYQARRGRAEVVGFFQSLAAVEFHQFEPKVYLAHNDTVVVLLDADYSVKATGKHVVYEDAVMIWKFNDVGQVTRFAHRVDTHQAWQACQA